MLNNKESTRETCYPEEKPRQKHTVAKAGVVRGGRAWRVLRVAAAGTECDEQWEEEPNRGRAGLEALCVEC